MTCYGCGEPCKVGQRCERCGFTTRAWVAEPESACSGCHRHELETPREPDKECGGCGSESSCRSGCRSGGEVVDEEPDDEEYPFWQRDQNYWWKT